MGPKKPQRQAKPAKGTGEGKKSTLTSDSRPPSAFSDQVKMEVKQEQRGRCWACEEPNVHIAHIIAREDTAYEFLQAQGLINFDVHSSQNGISLCPNCHAYYDNNADPGFVFWPEDLDFFIRFELRDRARRRRLPPGAQRQRRVPTAKQYQVYQEGTEPQSWGTYYRVHLVDGNARHVTEATPTKEWGGSPIGALRRAIAVIGCPRSFRIPPDAIKKLQILRDLYYGPEEKEAEVEKRLGLDPFEEPDDEIDHIDPSGQEHDEEEEGGEDEDDEDEEWVPPAKRRKTATPRRQADAIFNYRKWGWDFGPESSSEDKRKQFSVPELLGPRPL